MDVGVTVPLERPGLGQVGCFYHSLLPRWPWAQPRG